MSSEQKVAILVNPLENRYYRIFFHLLFWMVYIISITLFFGDFVGMKKVFYRTLISAFFLMAIVYFNLYYLMPKYFEKQRYFIYFLTLHIAIAVNVVLRLLIDFSLPLNFEQGNVIRNYFHSPTHFVSIVISVYTMLLLSMSLKFIKDYFVNIELRNRLKYQKVENELKQLKNQINPHFLFNVLGNIYSLAYMKSDIAPVMISKLSDMMRYVVYDCTDSKVQLSKEIKYLRDFIDLHNLRKDNKMNISFEVKGETDEIKIQPMLFLPLFENCFKHGNLEDLQNGWMKCNFTVTGKRLLLVLENTFTQKTAPDMQKDYKPAGIGIKNVEERLQLLFPEKYTFVYTKKDNVFRVRLSVNFE